MPALMASMGILEEHARLSMSEVVEIRHTDTALRNELTDAKVRAAVLEERVGAARRERWLLNSLQLTAGGLAGAGISGLVVDPRPALAVPLLFIGVVLFGITLIVQLVPRRED